MYSQELKKLVNAAKTYRNLGSFMGKNSLLKQKLIDETNFLPNKCSIRERLYHIEFNLHEPIKCDRCNNMPTWDKHTKQAFRYKKLCGNCSLESSERNSKIQSKRYLLYKNKYIGKANKIHKFKYDYSKTSYTKAHDDIEIICKKHGIFKRKAYEHLNGAGCPKCQKVVYITKEIFLNVSKHNHGNKYDYSLINDFKGHRTLDIVCKKHGAFKQNSGVHMGGSGCPKCANSGFSQKAIEWLEYISEIQGIYIQHALNEGEYKISGTLYHVDGYCQETNTCYEFLGDKFHGNLSVFKGKQIVHPYEDISVKECYDNTMERLKEIKNLGYNLVYIWENDYDKNYV